MMPPMLSDTADDDAPIMRLDEEMLVLGLGWRAAACITNEALIGWRYGTAGRFQRAADLAASRRPR